MKLTEEMVAFTGARGDRQDTHHIRRQPDRTGSALAASDDARAIRQYSEIDYAEHPDATNFVRRFCPSAARAGKCTWGKLVDGLLGDYVEPRLISRRL